MGGGVLHFPNIVPPGGNSSLDTATADWNLLNSSVFLAWGAFGQGQNQKVEAFITGSGGHALWFRLENGQISAGYNAGTDVTLWSGAFDPIQHRVWGWSADATDPHWWIGANPNALVDIGHQHGLDWSQLANCSLSMDSVTLGFPAQPVQGETQLVGVNNDNFFSVLTSSIAGFTCDVCTLLHEIHDAVIRTYTTS